MFTALRRPNRPRRGVTLVEMLVVVALVVLMMVILVQIFQSALGAMSASRTTQELDVVLRSIDSTIRSDLAGVTAKMTPPNDPALKQGYFEYSEGAPADLQGEDTDDFIAFTTKAKEGQVFTGRQYLASPANSAIQPITITSQVAEVIYFLRNGNLYRRVLLVVPDRSKSLTIGTLNSNTTYPITFGPLSRASWQGMNDISCRPVGFPRGGYPIPVPNDLGDLTNRENRAFRPRFSDDFSSGTLPSTGPDGIPDDNNGDGVPDYYPTLYYDGAGVPNSNLPTWSPNGLMNENVGYPANLGRVEQKTGNSYDVYAFPYIFPGLYLVPEGGSVTGTTVTPPAGNLGWQHGIFPSGGQQQNLNHAPLDVGDNLPPPAPALNQTWWGPPTWRETMTAYTGTSGWGDPVISVNTNSHQQPLGLRPLPPHTAYSINGANFLTPLALPGSLPPVPSANNPGSTSFIAINPLNHLWEDDLILTNVRSFDVKAYDPDAPLYNNVSSGTTYTNGPFSAGYQDLGYGASGYNAFSYRGGWLSNNGTPVTPPFQPFQPQQGLSIPGPPMGFGHAGRIPPIPNDFRIHPRRPTYVDSNGNTQFYNVGDSSVGVIRLTHTFDTWSTAYTNAPDSDILLNGYSAGSPSIYPSFPPPYPSPLRGIQIQIRVVDPRNERSKVLTIRHDFTDKLTN